MEIKSEYLNKPQLYEPSTGAFWDDEHISKGMLAAHLDPDIDAATRKYSFIEKSVKWIARVAPPKNYPQLLDLGCGPGLYAELFYKVGYKVMGLDFSRRSINYAKEQTQCHKSEIEYVYGNYLEMNYEDRFDVITLIYCDYAPLSLEQRRILAVNVYRALKQGGKLVLDVFTPKMRKKESQSWYYCEESNFWSEKAHLCLEATYQYDDDETELCRTVVITDDGVNVYNIWDHYFTPQKLATEVMSVGFEKCMFYGDVAGAELTDNSQTICGVFTK